MYKLIEEVLASSVWGASVAALVLDWNLQGFVVIVQFIVAIAGAIYFIAVKIPHDFKNNRLTRRRTSLQNEVLKHEIEDYEEEEANHKNITDEDKR
tara:strand:- start:675 stop:962 length:288 start_codon:yes stop_codon:yes gene_type:complete